MCIWQVRWIHTWLNHLDNIALWLSSRNLSRKFPWWSSIKHVLPQQDWLEETSPELPREMGEHIVYWETCIVQTNLHKLHWFLANMIEKAKTMCQQWHVPECVSMIHDTLCFSMWDSLTFHYMGLHEFRRLVWAWFLSSDLWSLLFQCALSHIR